MDYVEGDFNEKHKTDETGGGASSALGHTQPFIKYIGVQDAVSIRVDD